MKYLILSCWVLLNFRVYSQDIPADAIQAYENLKAESIRAHMRFLADDLLTGRKPFSQGYRIAAHYVASQFEEMGLRPAIGDTSYFQPVSLYINRSEIKGNMMVSIGNETKNMVAGEDFILLTEPESISREDHEIVFGGFGIQDPELGFTDLEKLDVRNKYVIIVFDFSADRSYEFHLKYSSRKLYENLKSAGASGVLLYIPPDLQSRLSWDYFKTVFNRERYQANRLDFPVFLMNWSVIDTLFETSGKNFEAYATGKNLPSQFRIRASVKPELEIIPDYEITESTNVIASLEGSDPELKNEYFIYTAHLDHIGTGREMEGDSIYNGAYDNASGIAIMLEMAKAYTRLQTGPKRTIMFIALTAEEMGLLGSEYYINHPVVPPDQTTAMLNLDMFLMEKPLDEIVALGEGLSELGQIAYRVSQLLGVRIVPDPLPEERIFLRSDHINFARAGIPAMFLVNAYDKSTTEGQYDDVNYRWLKTLYHSPLDNFREDIQYQAGVAYGQINFLIGYIAANRNGKVRWHFDF